jgi:arsenate reductase
VLSGIIGGVERPRVLFLCVHNSARSQMAEGLLRSMAGDGVVVRSAGLEAGRLRPEAVEVMAELGLDISAQRSKSVDEIAGDRFDVVVTTCDEAKEACPLFPGAFETLHWGIADPAAVGGDEETRLEAFREARDELWALVADLSRDLERTQFVSSRKR